MTNLGLALCALFPLAWAIDAAGAAAAHPTRPAGRHRGRIPGYLIVPKWRKRCRDPKTTHAMPR